MLGASKIICQCNNVNKKDLIKLIKELKITTLEELLAQNELKVGNKCKACRALDDESSLGDILKEANINILRVDF